MQKGFLDKKQSSMGSSKDDGSLNLSRAGSSMIAFSLEDFMPEAKAIIAEKLREYREDLATAERLEKKWHEVIYNNAPKEDVLLWRLIFHKYGFEPLTQGREANIKRLLRLQKPKKTKKEIGEAEIAKAKDYPISELVEFNHDTARCLWHHEKTGSMHYYPKDNHVHCFGCGKNGDAIDVYQAIYGCDFLSAVKALL